MAEPTGIPASATTSAAVAYALRKLRRGWRSGELLILALAIAVAVAAASAVGLFSGRINAALAAQAGDMLGADLAVSARDPLPPTVLAQLRATGARVVEITGMTSVVFVGEVSSLASIKAVAEGYPLRGALRTSDELFGAETPTAALPAAGEAWADARLYAELRIAPGATVQLGATTVKLSKVLTYEPDRGGGFTSMAPRLLMRAADLPATRLVVAGSRLQSTVLLAGTIEQQHALREVKLPPGAKLQTPQDARPELKSALGKASQFLDLAVLAATLLAAAAVALCARGQGIRLRDEVALLKCLGARQRFIVVALLSNLLAIGLGAGLAGAIVGYAAQALLAGVLASLLQIALPAPSLAPLGSALLLDLIMLLGFAAPSVLDARRVPPVRVFQRDLSSGALSRLVPVGAVAAVVALLWLQAGEFKLAAYVLLSVAITVAVLASLAWLLVLALAPMKRSVGTAWRFGLGNVARRRAASVAQAVALGQALLALLLLLFSRDDLLMSWKAQLKPGTPNQFLINVLPEQAGPLKKFFADRKIEVPPLIPMARSRLVALNGVPVTAETFDDPETQRWINREFNLSFAADLREDNKLVSGEWWSAEDHGKPLLSADKYAVDRLHLALGDRMTLSFGDRRVEFTVKSFREVAWDSFRPNFFLLTPPGALDAVPATWLTSFYLPNDRRAVLRELVQQFPNVTALDIEALMNQVRAIMDRVTRAVEFILMFTLAAGLTVLLATIEGKREERVRETGLLRALGARNGTILKGLLAEYAVLGALAGAVAAIAAQTLTWVLAANVFHIAYGPRPMLWLVGTVAGALLVTLLGWLSLRGTLKTPPHTVLRGTL